MIDQEIDENQRLDAQLARHFAKGVHFLVGGEAAGTDRRFLIVERRSVVRHAIRAGGIAILTTAAARHAGSRTAATEGGARKRWRAGGVSGRSMASISGSAAPARRLGRCSLAYLPASTFATVSRLGVADTSTAGAEQNRARTTAMSRAL